MKFKLAILSLITAIFCSSAMADDYGSICGKKLKDGETIRVILPVGGIITQIKKELPGNSTVIGGIYLASMTEDEVTFSSAIVGNVGSTFVSDDNNIGTCKVGKEIVIRVEGTIVPAIRINLISVNIGKGSVVVTITKFQTEPREVEAE